MRRVGSRGQDRNGAPDRRRGRRGQRLLDRTEDVRPGVLPRDPVGRLRKAEPADIVVDPRALGVDDQPLRVSLRRSEIVETDDLALWEVIRAEHRRAVVQPLQARSSTASSAAATPRGRARGAARRWTEAPTPFDGGRRRPAPAGDRAAVPRHRGLQACSRCATEAFMLTAAVRSPTSVRRLDEDERRGARLPGLARLRRPSALPRDIPARRRRRARTLEKDRSLRGRDDLAQRGRRRQSRVATLPYLAAVRENFPEVPLSLPEVAARRGRPLLRDPHARSSPAPACSS